MSGAHVRNKWGGDEESAVWGGGDPAMQGEG